MRTQQTRGSSLIEVIVAAGLVAIALGGGFHLLESLFAARAFRSVTAEADDVLRRARVERVCGRSGALPQTSGPEGWRLSPVSPRATAASANRLPSEPAFLVPSP